MMQNICNNMWHESLRYEKAMRVTALTVLCKVYDVVKMVLNSKPAESTRLFQDFLPHLSKRNNVEHLIRTEVPGAGRKKF